MDSDTDEKSGFSRQEEAKVGETVKLADGDGLRASLTGQAKEED